MYGCLSVHVGICRFDGMSIHLYIVCLWVCSYVCMSVCNLGNIWGGYLSVCQGSLCLSVHPFVFKSINCLSEAVQLGLSYHIIIIFGHIQCHVQLAWIPGVFSVMFLMLCFHLLELETYRCEFRLHAADSCCHDYFSLKHFHYVSSYFYYHHSTYSNWVLQYFISHHNCYHGSHIDGTTSDIWSA